MLRLRQFLRFGCFMIRLTLALLATMFLTFQLVGVDRGQVRYGLLASAAETALPQALPIAEPDEPVAEAIYVPTPAVIEAAEPATAAAITAAVAQAVIETVPEPAPLADPVVQVMFISGNSVNVREGPGKDFAVIEKLVRGEAVSVISASDGVDGWTLITIEGDGLEGYVSTALLSDQP